MSPQQIAVIVVAATLGLLVALLVAYGRPRRTKQEPAPANFSRGDPDSVLEGPRLDRMLVWSLASAIFITAFLVVYFMYEPFREASYAGRFHEQSVERGQHEFVEEAGCAACHGPEGEGGFASTDPNWPAPPLNNILARYTRDDVTQIIAMGRPGTPMPTWAVEFGGPLNAQKIEDIVNFIEAIQLPSEEQWELPEDITSGAEVFARKCAVCHGENAQGQGMGQPIPTFFAPDLTTEFMRLGLKVKREEITIELRNQLLAERADRTEPTEEEIEAELAAAGGEAIIEAGEEAVRQTINQGRENTPMPGWANRITEEQVEAVIDYLRSIQSSGQGQGA